MNPKIWSFLAMSILSVGVAIYALWAYGAGVQRVPVHPAMALVFDQHRVLITTHAVGAAVALLLGPFQFLDRWRASLPRVHRVLGHCYLLLGVGMGGVSGVLLARFSFGGLVAHLGFGLLGCLWIVTGIWGLHTVKQRRFNEHRQWMTRSYALALAAVTLRLYVPTALAAGVRFEDFYPAVAWLCWVPNLIVVEWWLKKPGFPARVGS